MDRKVIEQLREREAAERLHQKEAIERLREKEAAERLREFGRQRKQELKYLKDLNMEKKLMYS